MATVFDIVKVFIESSLKFLLARQRLDSQFVKGPIRHC